MVKILAPDIVGFNKDDLYFLCIPVCSHGNVGEHPQHLHRRGTGRGGG